MPRHGSLMVLPLLTACASGVVEVGDRRVSGAALRPYTNLWTWSVTDARGVHPQGTWSDRFEIESAEGKPVGRRTQEQRLPDGRVVLTVNVFDLATMAPLEREWRAFDGRRNLLRFHGSEVEQRLVAKPGAAEESNQFKLSAPVFDFNGGMYGLLLRAFPLRDGYSGTLRAISEDGGKMQEVRFAVRGREQVPGRGGGPVQAYRVEADTPDYGVMTFWLSDEAPYIIRLSFRANGGLILYEMV
jgi:hypothetical protein